MTVHAITTYFNPCHYRRRRDNYHRFIQGLRIQGVPCLTIESANPGEEFELSPGPGIIQIRAEALMWQKERLLNLAAKWLPEEYQTIAWLDCDVLFENNAWASELESVIQTHPGIA